MTRQTILEGALLAIGFVVGVGKPVPVILSAAKDLGMVSGASPRSFAEFTPSPRSFAALRMTGEGLRMTSPATKDDTVAVTRLLAVVRGGDPLVCEMAVRTVDMHGSWSMWGPMSGDPLVVDSTSATLLDWIQRKHDDPALVPRLRAALRDDDGCVRRMAGSLLGRVRHPSALSALTAALDDQKAGTREVAAFGLGMADSKSAVDPLIARLRDGTPAVRRASAWALGQLEDKKALPSLVGLLMRDSDPRVRQTAAWAIGSIH